MKSDAEIKWWLRASMERIDGDPREPTDDEFRIVAGHVAANIDRMFPGMPRAERHAMQRDLLRFAGDQRDAWKDEGVVEVMRAVVIVVAGRVEDYYPSKGNRHTEPCDICKRPVWRSRVVNVYDVLGHVGYTRATGRPHIICDLCVNDNPPPENAPLILIIDSPAPGFAQRIAEAHPHLFERAHPVPRPVLH